MSIYYSVGIYQLLLKLDCTGGNRRGITVEKH